MDIYTKLKSDHRSISSLLKVLASTTNKETSKREELFKELYYEMETHAKVEEKDFYNELRRYEDDFDLQDLLNHSVEEHVEIDNYLLKLKSLPLSSDKWLVTVKELKKVFEEHIKEEESELFQMAKEHLKKSEESLLGNKFEVDETYLSKTLSI